MENTTEEEVKKVVITDESFEFDDYAEDLSLIVPKKDGVKAKAKNFVLREIGKDTKYLAIGIDFVEAGTGASFNFNLIKPKTKDECVTDQDVKNRMNTMKRLIHIVGALSKVKLTKEYLAEKLQGKTYEQIFEHFKSILDPEYTKLELKLKIVYNKKGNLDFPLFPDFISSVLKPRDFTFDPNYDFIEKPAKIAESGSEYAGM